MAEKHSLNAKLYKALENNETEIVSQMCEEVDEHGLHILTSLDNTVLHMPTYANKSELVLRLLQELPNHHLDKLGRQNQLGDTILYMTAISNDKTHEVARKLLEKAPGLLCMHSNLGETALFWSVRYDNKEMFHYFAKNILGYEYENQILFIQRTDKTAILHIAILSKNFRQLKEYFVSNNSTLFISTNNTSKEHFFFSFFFFFFFWYLKTELALEIAEKFERLVGERDADGMTGLQLLSCNPGAFQCDDELGFFNSGWYT